jgi:hypothetical protein
MQLVYANSGLQVTDEWDFCLLGNSAIKLLFLQEGAEFWAHELFMDRGTESEYRQNFPDLFKQLKNLFEYVRMNYGTKVVLKKLCV